MKYPKTIIIAVWLLVSIAGGEGNAAESPAVFRRDAIAHGAVTLKMIEDRFYLPRSRVYADSITLDNSHRPNAAFAWGCGVQLTALTAAAHVDEERYLPLVRRYAAELDAYWINANGIGGYNSSAHPRSPDRYYDDNAWLVLGMVEAYELTHDPMDLQRAKACEHFVLSGEDNKLGGGLYWRENDKHGKNTCSNAPGICGALRVFKYTRDPQLFKTAKRLYDWTRGHLQDSDGLYFDAINLDGRIGRTKWTYNTAMMIRAACVLYDNTHDIAYLKEAERVAGAAEHRWVKPSGAISNPACFAHLLAGAFLDLSARDHNPHWRDLDHAAVNFLWAHNRDPDGFYPDRWDESGPAKLNKVALISQASAARAYFRAAWGNNEK